MMFDDLEKMIEKKKAAALVDTAKESALKERLKDLDACNWSLFFIKEKTEDGDTWGVHDMQDQLYSCTGLALLANHAVLNKVAILTDYQNLAAIFDEETEGKDWVFVIEQNLHEPIIIVSNIKSRSYILGVFEDRT